MSFLNMETMSALRAATVPADGSYALLAGYHRPGDGGGGSFVWSAASTDADNGGTVIAADAGGSGRWLRSHAAGIDPLAFGAAGDGVGDDGDVLAAVDAFAAAADVTVVVSRNHRIDRHLTLAAAWSFDCGGLTIGAEVMPSTGAFTQSVPGVLLVNGLANNTAEYYLNTVLEAEPPYMLIDGRRARKNRVFGFFQIGKAVDNWALSSAGTDTWYLDQTRNPDDVGPVADMADSHKLWIKIDGVYKRLAISDETLSTLGEGEFLFGRIEGEVQNGTLYVRLPGGVSPNSYPPGSFYADYTIRAPEAAAPLGRHLHLCWAWGAKGAAVAEDRVYTRHEFKDLAWAAPYVVRFQRPVSAAPDQRLFFGDGTAAMPGETWLAWFGTDPDSDDNYDAIQAAFDSAWLVGGNTVRHHDTRLLKICFGRTETPPPLLIPSHTRVEIDAVIQIPADYNGLAGGPVLLNRSPEAGIGISGRLAIDCNGAPNMNAIATGTSDLAGMAGQISRDIDIDAVVMNTTGDERTGQGGVGFTLQYGAHHVRARVAAHRCYRAAGVAHGYQPHLPAATGLSNISIDIQATDCSQFFHATEGTFPALAGPETASTIRVRGTGFNIGRLTGLYNYGRIKTEDNIPPGVPQPWGNGLIGLDGTGVDIDCDIVNADPAILAANKPGALVRVTGACNRARVRFRGNAARGVEFGMPYQPNGEAITISTIGLRLAEAVKQDNRIEVEATGTLDETVSTQQVMRSTVGSALIPFAAGTLVTGQTSGATGMVMMSIPTRRFVAIRPSAGGFVAGEVVSDGTSSFTIDTIAAVVGSNIISV